MEQENQPCQTSQGKTKGEGVDIKQTLIRSIMYRTRNEYISYFSVAVIKYTTKQRGFILAHSSRESSSWWERCGNCQEKQVTGAEGWLSTFHTLEAEAARRGSGEGL